MLDLVRVFLLSQPRLMTTIGRIVYRFAAFQVLTGVVAQIAVSALRRTQPQMAARWIADVWPGVPLWWVPETVIGMIAVTTLAAIGLAIAYGGRQFERQWT